MPMHHPYAIGGLVLNMIATVMLLRYPPTVQLYTPDGRPIWNDEGPQLVDGPRRYRIQSSGYKLAIALLWAGFLLQLIDLIHS